MTKDILIRDLDVADVHWLDSSRPSGITQNEFLRSIIQATRLNGKQLDLFQPSLAPNTLYGALPFKFIDLFAGIGGFRSGMTAVGGECVFTSEWDKYANKTYQTWFRDSNIHSGDIREISIKKEIPNHDVLCAGFPCQPFSIAGVSKKKSLGRSHGFEDVKQGNLFFSILDIIDAKRPPVLFLENVKNLKSHDKGNTWQTIQTALEKRKYSIFSKIIDAQAVVPQHRERILIVCFDKKVFGDKSQIEFEFPIFDKYNKPTLSEILEESPDKKYMLSDKLWVYLKNYAKKHKAKGNGFGYGLFSGKDIARTMSARYYKDGSEILIRQKGWRNPRRLTPRESCLLLGFDDKYARLFGHQGGFPQVVSDTQAYKQFGNSVVPIVIEAVAQNIVDVMGKVFMRTGSGCLLKSRQLNSS